MKPISHIANSSMTSRYQRDAGTCARQSHGQFAGSERLPGGKDFITHG